MMRIFWFATVWFIHSLGLFLALMPVSIMQWRLQAGIFNAGFYIRCKSNALWSLTVLLYTIAGIAIALLSVFLLLCGDNQLNPGPNKKRNSWFNFSICHWNLNSLTVHNYEKVNFSETYSTVINFDTIFNRNLFLIPQF